MKIWFVVMFVVFNLTQSELVYLLYDVTSVPTLDNVCGLSPTQITAAQQRYLIIIIDIRIRVDYRKHNIHNSSIENKSFFNTIVS